MMQNRSFDHLFGTYPPANGLDPGAASYAQKDKAGKTITPSLLGTLSTPDIDHSRGRYMAVWDKGRMDKYAFYNGDSSMKYYDDTSNAVISGKSYGVGTLWSYAQNYALADNYFASAMGNEPANGLYMIASYIGTGSAPFSYPQLDKCSKTVQAKQGGTITPPIAAKNVGDQLSAKGVTWGWYQEHFDAEQSGTCTSYIPHEDPFQYFTSTANGSHVKNFTLTSLKSLLSAGTLPEVMWIQPGSSNSMHPGSGSIANGVKWLDGIVQAVKASNAWPTTGIIVLWDESGGWYDHVPPPQLAGTIGLGARVPVLFISPFAKTGHVSHVRMDHVSILRFIQWNWGLGKFTGATQAAREAQSGDLCDLMNAACAAP